MRTAVKKKIEQFKDTKIEQETETVEEIKGSNHHELLKIWLDP